MIFLHILAVREYSVRRAGRESSSRAFADDSLLP
jgi:hypothetical protein